jgi:hypothetical protein
MLKPKSVVESIADLRRLGSSFRSLIAYAGDDAVKHWHRLRAMGDTILNDIWLETHSSPRSAFDAIEGFRNQDLSAWPRSSCDHNRLFKRLVGFEFEPRYRSFMATWPFFFEDGSHLTRELCFSPGLVFQPVILVDPELADDLERLWPLHRFELLDRCANGCEMIIEIVEREMATVQAPQQADNQADEDGVIDVVARKMIWGDEPFDDIPPRGIKVLSLLLDAYRDGNRVVTLGEIENLRVSVDGGMINQVFKAKGGRHPVSVIVDDLGGGRYRLKPPRKNT